MALVSYGDSDGSDLSDTDEADAPPSSITTFPAQTGPPTTSPPRTTKPDKVGDQKTIGISDPEASNLPLNLPKPKERKHGIIQEGELEDYVKRTFPTAEDEIEKPSTSSNSLGVVRKRKFGKVQITAPSVADYASDDSDSDEGTSATVTTSKKGSSLCSLLPAPVNVTIKQTNRALIPHSLTKKPNVTSSAARPSHKKAVPLTADSEPAVCRGDGDVSDDEGDGSGDFFSLSHSTRPVAAADATVTRSVTRTPLSSSLPPPKLSTSSLLPSGPSTTSLLPSGPSTSSLLPSGPSTTSLLPSGPSTSSLPPPTTSKTSLPAPACSITPTPPSSHISPQGHTSDVYAQMSSRISSQRANPQDAPLQFKPSPSLPYGDSSSSSSSSGRFVQPTTSYQHYHHDDQLPTSEEYPESWQPPITEEGSIDQEKLLRLQGIQGLRKGEQIEFVDVHADDALSDRPADWLMRSVNEELSEKPSSKKDKNFRGITKTRHQITYLAFQAKEKEIELKNQWSANRHTRRETQSKYGF